MTRWATLSVLLLTLGACGAPQPDIARVSQGAELPAEPGNNALPSEEELAREDPVLTELFRAEADGAPDVPQTAQPVQAPAPRGGVLGWLRGVGADRNAPGSAHVAAETAHAPGGVDVPPGHLLPFGEIGRDCTAKPARVGKLVDKAARKGRGYALYDTAPDSTAPRIFYVTCFSDNCPRQFTAALALFGDPAFHEQLRYGLPADEYPYSSTDQAYETLKRRVCNVGPTIPCGDRVDRLSRNTTFISAYENFTDNARWADMLLHDGTVLATALKTP